MFLLLSKSKKRKKKDRDSEGAVGIESVLKPGKYTSGAAEEKRRKEDEAQERAAKAREVA